MKFIQKFLLKRRNHHSNNQLKKSSNKNQQREDITRSETPTTDDTSFSTESRADSSNENYVPWKAENFLQNGAPPSDSDWWESDDGDDDDDESDIDADLLDDEDASMTGVHANTEVISHDDGGVEEITDVNINTGNNNNKGKRFRNRGYATWVQGRQAWKNIISDPPIAKAPPIPQSFRKDLVKCLGDRRQFELSHRIPLTCLINCYQDVWNDPNTPNE